MINGKTAALFSLIFLFPINLHSQQYHGKQKHIQQILKNVANFSQYVMAGDHEKIAASYTSDGKIFPNGIEIIEGVDGLEKYWTRSPGYKTTMHKITPTEIRIVKKYAYDYGYYEGESVGKDGKKSTWRGKYVIVWKKVGKDWKIYLDIWNSIQ